MIDLNTATAAELDAVSQLKGHGFEVVRYREERGRFDSLRQLDELPGLALGSGTARRLRSRSVEAQARPTTATSGSPRLPSDRTRALTSANPARSMYMWINAAWPRMPSARQIATAFVGKQRLA